MSFFLKALVCTSIFICTSENNMSFILNYIHDKIWGPEKPKQHITCESKESVFMNCVNNFGQWQQTINLNEQNLNKLQRLIPSPEDENKCYVSIYVMFESLNNRAKINKYTGSSTAPVVMDDALF